jgi:hypothetical protein
MPKNLPHTSVRAAADAPPKGTRVTLAHLDRSSKNRLTAPLATLFASDSLFDRVARVMCQAGVLPRKELFESWEVARRARRRLRGTRVVDLCAGHGLVSYLMLLLDPRLETAISVDVRQPKSASVIAAAMCSAWPELANRVRFEEASLDQIELFDTDVVVSVHACGTLTDRVLDLATQAQASLAVLPCCQARGEPLAAMLEGWLDAQLAIDVIRVARLAAAGYRVWTQRIDPEITDKNRLLLAAPEARGRRAQV